MFEDLERINQRPKPFEFYTAEELWTNEHTAKKMLEYHLNEAVDLSTRNAEFMRKSVEWIIKRFNVCANTEIADFGCGPGLYATPLAEKGAKVTGIDFSKNSLDYAEKTADKKGLNIKYIYKNYLDFETDKKFDLVMLIFGDYCALSSSQRKRLLNKFQKILKPNGSILLDVLSLNTFNQRKESATYELNSLDGFWSAENYYGFLNTFKYDQEKVTLDKYTIIEKNRTHQVYNWLQHFDKSSLSKEVQEIGLYVDEFYSDVAGKPFDPEANELTIVAKNKHITDKDSLFSER